jgi:hypothetical protein
MSETVNITDIQVSGQFITYNIPPADNIFIAFVTSYEENSRFTLT